MHTYTTIGNRNRNEVLKLAPGAHSKFTLSAMTLHISSRADLVTNTAANPNPALLLEGCWSEDIETKAGTTRWDLDQLIDVNCSWVDDEAIRLADQIGFKDKGGLTADEPISLAYINSLALRYYLVKLLRLVALFERGLAPAAFRDAEFHGIRGRDEDYAQILNQLWRLHGVRGSIHWDTASTASNPTFAQNAPWRRAASFVNRMSSLPGGRDLSTKPRVVLCGNPRILDPVCEELIRRDCSVWWLYDRFAVRSWLKWRPRGVGQLVCDSSLGRENRLPLVASRADKCGDSLASHGVDFGPVVHTWLSRQANTHGTFQTRIIEQLTAHFDEISPSHVVLDEDATPLARSAVAVARRTGAVSSLAQNAATGVRFGFVPLVADQVCAWGETSRWQYERWGVDPSRINVTGSPWHDSLMHQLNATRRKTPAERSHIVVFLTPPARDDRPDVVSYHKTSRTYRQMLDWVCRSLYATPGIRVTFKLHPRRAGREYIEQILGEFPSFDVRFVEQAPLARMLREASGVISLGSSAGIEAALDGVPVIQVLPEGSGNFLPAPQWGMLGTARSRAELEELIGTLLATSTSSPSAEVFANLQGTASSDVVDAVLKNSAVERGTQPVLHVLPFSKAPDRLAA